MEESVTFRVCLSDVTGQGYVQNFIDWKAMKLIIISSCLIYPHCSFFVDFQSAVFQRTIHSAENCCEAVVSYLTYPVGRVDFSSDSSVARRHLFLYSWRKRTRLGSNPHPCLPVWTFATFGFISCITDGVTVQIWPHENWWCVTC